MTSHSADQVAGNGHAVSGSPTELVPVCASHTGLLPANEVQLLPAYHCGVELMIGLVGAQLVLPVIFFQKVVFEYIPTGSPPSGERAIVVGAANSVTTPCMAA